MPADTTVKFLHSAMAGAPVLAGQAGSLIGLLDACLVNGFGSGTVDSVVIAGGVGTVTRSAGHPAEVDAVMLLAGATVSGGSINGEHKVVSATGTTWTFDATGIGDQTATGTITHKMAPLGWAKTFSGTNLAAYKPTDVTATGNMLRVDDTGTTSGRVVGYESMSDVNTGVGPFPTAAQVSGGGFWSKSDAASAAARPWILCGDGRIFYLAVAFTNSAAYSFGAVFGDLASTKSPDAYSCLLNCFATALTTTPGNVASEYDYSDPTQGFATYLPRNYTGLGGSVVCRKTFPYFVSSAIAARSGAVTGGTPFPNYADGGLYVTPHYISETLNGVLRGASPGFYCSPQNMAFSGLASRDRIAAVSGLSGRAVRLAISAAGVFFFDVTGPWR